MYGNAEENIFLELRGMDFIKWCMR